ncbi:hypothetical protein C0J52_13482 [Blattella germanica]|nr:hypothetical protein C0J52_13482 [Blattella germanica]
MLDRDNNKFRKSSIAPVMDDFIARVEDNDAMIMEERGNYAPLHRRVQQAAATAWSGENVAIAITDLLGPYARKEWNLPVGSHRNPFWRITRRFSSPRKVKEVLNKSLVLCCTLGSPPLVKNLLEAGAEPNGESGKWGPLHSAAYGGNSEIMRVLLEDPRTYPDSVEEKGKTALHLAAKKGNYEVEHLLCWGKFLQKDILNVLHYS